MFFAILGGNRPVSGDTPAHLARSGFETKNMTHLCVYACIYIYICIYIYMYHCLWSKPATLSGPKTEGLFGPLCQSVTPVTKGNKGWHPNPFRPNVGILLGKQHFSQIAGVYWDQRLCLQKGKTGWGLFCSESTPGGVSLAFHWGSFIVQFTFTR